MNSVGILLSDLEALGVQYPEVIDPKEEDIRKRILDAIFYGFIHQEESYDPPRFLNTYRVDSDSKLREILLKFLDDANTEAERNGLESPRQRWDVFFSSFRVKEYFEYQEWLRPPGIREQAVELCENRNVALMQRMDSTAKLEIAIAGVARDRMSYQIVCTKSKQVTPMCSVSLELVGSLEPHPHRINWNTQDDDRI